MGLITGIIHSELLFNSFDPFGIPALWTVGSAGVVTEGESCDPRY